MARKTSIKRKTISISSLIFILEMKACDLRCVHNDMDSYHWEVIEHWEQKPNLRTIGTGETVEKALLNAFGTDFC